MGDRVELRTGSERLNKYFHANSGSFAFEVKASGYVYVCLTEKPTRRDTFYEIFLGAQNNRVSVIKKDRSQTKATSETPDILCRNSFRGFYLTWCNNTLKVFEEGNQIPFLQYTENDMPCFKYITFGSISNVIAEWIFDVPPMKPRKESANVKGGIITWKTVDEGQIPEDAFIGGYETEPLVIMRSQHQGSLTPGKLVLSSKIGYIAWGGFERRKHNYEVLCGYNGKWIQTTGVAPIPRNAVFGGYSEDGDTLFIGRVKYEGHLICGKVQPSHRTCYIPYEGREIAKSEFEILCSNIEEEETNLNYIVEYSGLNNVFRQDGGLVHLHPIHDDENEVEFDDIIEDLL